MRDFFTDRMRFLVKRPTLSKHGSDLPSACSVQNIVKEQILIQSISYLFVSDQWSIPKKKKNT